MPIYINSKGEEIETSELEERHLQRAYDKAVRENNEDNIKALQEEINTRNGDETTTDDTSIEDDITDISAQEEYY
jgi:hypothetical protein